MNKEQFAPGLYIAINHDGDTDDLFLIDDIEKHKKYIDDSTEGNISFSYIPVKTGGKNGVADGNKAAAAPDMYEALKEMLDSFRFIRSEDGDFMSEHEAFKDAEAALNKANPK